MKKKNGFISTTVVYTFFFVFLMMLLFIISRYSNNRVLLRTMKKDIKEQLDANIPVSFEGDFYLYIKSLYKTDGVNNLYLHNSSLANGAGDNSLRYAGSSETTNNYVCFGTDAENCPDDNLYRIIGVFDKQVKLIKADFANSNMLGTNGTYNEEIKYKESINTYYWHNNSTNDWEETSLNKINLNVNYTNYLNNQNPKWINMISDIKWNVGGYSTPVINAKTFYDAEIGQQTSESSKIGLMQVSDYMYAASPTYWTYIGMRSNSEDVREDYRVAINDNWMYMRLYEWVITPYSGNVLWVFGISHEGNISFFDGGKSSIPVRPVFYLKPNVQLVSGNGMKTNPYRIGVEE